VVLNCWHCKEGNYNPQLYMVNFNSSGTCSNSAVMNLVHVYFRVMSAPGDVFQVFIIVKLVFV